MNKSFHISEIDAEFFQTVDGKKIIAPDNSAAFEDRTKDYRNFFVERTV